jgi:hypothetical protein
MIARIREPEEPPRATPALSQARRLVAQALLPQRGKKAEALCPTRRWKTWGLLASTAALVALYAAHLAGWI